MENMENNNTAAEQGNEPQAGATQEKTFTQAEVDKIVSARLARERAASEPDARELDLQRREADLYLREVLTENNLPNDLYDGLKGMDKKTVDQCIKVFAPYVKKASEPINNPVLLSGGHVTGGDAIRAAMGLKR